MSLVAPGAAAAAMARGPMMRSPSSRGRRRYLELEIGIRRAVAYVLGDGSGLGSVPERFLSGPWRGGSATPMEMMYLSASSTVMSSSIASERGTTRKKPAVMLGVVGTKTET